MMNRRDFVKATAGTVFTSAFIANTFAAGKKRPNIVWISCEDISAHLGCFGEKYAKTPNIDSFATEGVRYTRAFTVAGVCAPSRSGIISGMYPSGLGSCHMRCQATIPDNIRCYPEYLRKAGYYCTNASKKDYNFKEPKSVWDASSGKAHWKNAPAGKPFFAIFNYTGTHESKMWDSVDLENTRPKRLTRDQYQDPENMTPWPIYPDTPAVRKDFARLFERVTEFDYYVKKRIDEIKKAGLYEDTIIFVWSDHGSGLPRAKRWLYDTGTLSPIIVRVPKKFRVKGQAVPGSIDNQLVNFIDLGPTTMNLAGIDIPSNMFGRAFLGDNLSSPRDYIFGARDRIDEYFDTVRSVRDKRYRYIRNFQAWNPYLPYLEYAENCNTMKEMRRLHAAGELGPIPSLWMADHRPYEELYDLDKDPFETRNLAGDAKYKDVQARLSLALDDWMLETEDKGLLTEPELRARAAKVGCEYEIFKKSEDSTLLKRLLTVAKLAGDPTADDKPALLKALQDRDASVRYWAVCGLGRLKSCGQDVLGLIEKAASDSSSVVRTAAARSLYWNGKTADAVRILSGQLNDSNIDEQIHLVLHVLTTMGKDAKPAKAAIRKLKNRKFKNRYPERVRDKLLEDL